MKALFTAMAQFCCLLGFGQVLNGDFEAQLQHWTSTCPSSTAVSTDVPPGGGQYSVQMPMLTPTETCYVLNSVEPYIHQELPSVVNGDDLFLSYWHQGSPIDPNEAALMTSLHLFGWFDAFGVFNPLPNQGGGVNAGPWALRTANFTVTGLPAGEPLVLALAGHALGNSVGGTVRFDNVGLTVNGTVAVQDLDKAGVSAHPIPAQGTLTITARSPIVAVQLRDPAGQLLRSDVRMIGPHTCALELNGLPAGMFLVTIRTIDGSSVVRFPKQ